MFLNKSLIYFHNTTAWANCTIRTIKTALNPPKNTLRTIFSVFSSLFSWKIAIIKPIEVIIARISEIQISIINFSVSISDYAPFLFSYS
jgi:hypothetical protein